MTASADGKASITADGTIDAYQGKPGKSATLEAMLSGKPDEPAALTLRVPPATPHAERDVAKLHLAADVNVGHQMPVTVRVASLDASGKPTGTLVGEWLPPCAGSCFRHGIDLGAMTMAGGTFDATATSFDVSFDLSPMNGQASRETLHVDNVSLSAPSFCAAPARAIVIAGRIYDYTFEKNVYFGDPGTKIEKGDAGDSDNVVADPKFKGRR